MFLTVETLPLSSVIRMCCLTVCGVGPCVLFTLCTEIHSKNRLMHVTRHQ